MIILYIYIESNRVKLGLKIEKVNVFFKTLKNLTTLTLKEPRRNGVVRFKVCEMHRKVKINGVRKLYEITKRV